MKTNIMRKAYYFFIILGLLIFIQPVSSFAATKDSSNQNEVKILEKDKIYKYDLDGDGKNESLKYKLTVDESKFQVTFKLYIDSKLCHKETSNGFSYRVYLFDLNQDDDCLDIFFHPVKENDCAGNASLVQYNKDGTLTTANFKTTDLTYDISLLRYSIVGVTGNGYMTLRIDTPFESTSIGCYYCYMSCYIEDGDITFSPANTFLLDEFSSSYKYKAAKAITAYKTAGSKTVAYKVKKGDKVTFDAVYVSKTGKVYCRMVNSKGKKGWIRSDLKNLFTELQAWG